MAAATLLAGAAQGAPSNDNFASRITLSGLPTSASGNNLGATAQAGEPDHAGWPAEVSVWWSWNCPSNAAISIDTFGSDFDTVLAVYTGTKLNTLAEKASNDDAGGVLQSRVRFAGTAGTDYKIAVDGSAGAQGSIQLHIAIAPQPPPNDLFANALALTGVPVSASGSNIAATAEAGEPDHAGELASASVWWTWRPPSNAVVRIDTLGSDFDTVLAVYTGATLATLGGIAANDDYGAAQSRLAFRARSNVTYRIAVDSPVGTEGRVALNILAGSPPSNDDFSNRIAVAGLPASAPGNNVDATAEPGEPAHDGFPSVASVWWSWLAPASATVFVDSSRSAGSTRLGVYTGTNVASLVSVGGLANGDRIRFGGQGGTRYAIAVDRLDGVDGDVVLDILAASSPVIRGVAAVQSAAAMRIDFTGDPGSIYAAAAAESLTGSEWFVVNTTMMTGTAAAIDVPLDPAWGSRLFRIEPGPTPP